MSSYPPEEILRKWTQGDLTAEQAIGHLVQQVLQVHQRLLRVERSLEAAAAGISSGEPKK
jgi:hypothetical protein